MTQQLVGGWAQYEMPDGAALRLELTNGPLIMTRDGAWNEAYALTISVDGTPTYVARLNETLHVLRTEIPCAIRANSCTHAVIQWGVAGGLAIYGVGLGLTNKRIQYHIGPTSYVADKEQNGDVIRLKSQAWPPELAGLLQPGTYTFKGSAVFPSAFDFSIQDVRIEGIRIQYEEIPIRAIQSTPSVVVALDGPRFSGIVASESDSLMGQTRSLAELVGELRAQSPEADARLQDGGCVTRMRVFPAMPSSDLMSRHAIASIQVGDGSPAAWDLYEEKGLLGTNYVAEAGAYRQDAGTCTNLRQGPGNLHSAAEFEEWANNLGLAVGDRLQFVVGQTENPGWLATPAAGLVRYDMQWQTNGDSADAVQAIAISQHASTGWLDRAIVIVDDQRQFTQ